MIEMTVKLKGLERARSYLKAAPDKIDAAVASALLSVGTIGARLASDKAPYKRGHLKRSIHWEPGSPTNRVTVGTNLEYARILEKGFTGTQSVRAHSMLMKRAFGRKITPRIVAVRAHTREVNRSGRPYLKPAFEQIKDVYLRQELTHFLRLALAGYL